MALRRSSDPLGAAMPVVELVEGPSTDQQWEQAERLSLGRLISFLQESDLDKTQLAAAKVAVTLLSAKTRREQARGAQTATLYQMARDLAQNKDQLQQYIRATLPDHPLVQALPAPNGVVAAAES